MRRDILTLSDGRDVDVVEVGDAAGKPVIWCHGTPMGPSAVLSMDEDAAEARLRIICAGRPGYADSSPAEPGSTTVVRDTREVAAHLGVSRYAVVGVSGGAPFAAAVAATAHEDVVTLGVLVGAGPPSVMPAKDDQDDAEERRLMALAAVGNWEEAAVGLREIARRWVAGLAVAEQVPAFIRDAVLDGTRRGYDGYVFDCFSSGLPWEVDVATVTCPAHLVYGDADRNCPPEIGRWYQERIPGAELTVLPGLDHRGAAAAGQALILPRLVDAF